MKLFGIGILEENKNCNNNNGLRMTINTKNIPNWIRKKNQVSTETKTQETLTECVIGNFKLVKGIVHDSTTISWLPFTPSTQMFFPGPISTTCQTFTLPSEKLKLFSLLIPATFFCGLKGTYSF